MTLFEGNPATGTDGHVPADETTEAQSGAVPDMPVPAVDDDDGPMPAAVETADETASAGQRQDINAAVPEFLSPPRKRSTHPVAWAVLALAMATTLTVQAALAFRAEISVLWPPARRHIESACGMLGCEVRLPRRADLMSIESSDLQADPQRQGAIVLNALLRNRAPFAQEYPSLELTLTDQGDQPVIRRVLLPADYLQEKRAALASGLGGGAEEAVRIHLETGGLTATGYQLFLFYPCPAAPASAFWQLSYPARCQDPRAAK